MTNVPRQVTHWDLLEHFAPFDRAHHPCRRARLGNLLLAARYAIARSTSIDLRARRRRPEQADGVAHLGPFDGQPP